MWEHYRKTLVGMQAMIVIMTVIASQLFNHQWIMVAVFFAVLQLGALFGSLFAARVNSQIKRRQSMLPLEGRL